MRFMIVASLAVVLGGTMRMSPATNTRAELEQTAAPVQLVDDTLKQMLDNMGLEPKPLSKGFLVALKRESWTLNMQLVLSDNKSKLGMNANLGIVENPDSITAAQWRALLVSNGNIEPSMFYFDEERKKLYLHRALDNRSLTPAYLREQIDIFAGQIKSTGDLWKFTK